MASGKKSMGRLKVNMVKMEKESNLQVTFSKRRAGLFKKASELWTLCGAEAAIIIFSPGKKAYSFGHPSVDEVLDRFLTPNPQPNPDSNQLVRVHQGASVQELNARINFLNCRLEDERKHNLLLDGLNKDRQGDFWWETPTERLGLEQLLELNQELAVLKERVSRHINHMQMEASNPPPPMGVSPLEGINGLLLNRPNRLGQDVAGFFLGTVVGCSSP